MRICNTTLFVLIYLCFAGKLQAQGNDSTFFRHAIKSNVLQWVVNEPNIIYEYRINEGIGIEVTVGAFLPGETKEILLYGHLQNGGLVCRINPKFYLPDDRKFYISPMVLLKNTSYTGVLGSQGRDLIFNGSFDTRTNAKETNKVFGFGGLAGYQIFVNENLIFDIFGGFTFRFKDYHVIHYKSVANSQSGPCENGYPCSFSKKSEQIMPQAGVKLGFGLSP